MRVSLERERECLKQSHSRESESKTKHQLTPIPSPKIYSTVPSEIMKIVYENNVLQDINFVTGIKFPDMNWIIIRYYQCPNVP